MGDGTVTGSAGSLNGNCYTKQECDQLGGTAAGNCAESYGVCCVCKNGVTYSSLNTFPVDFHFMEWFEGALTS